ncbi:MAG: hypothetical protein CVV62_01400 [Tenericutes bacterium HGW-Tenericutes-7]|jgi:hypothetical protein|nr:MAG: hypothetical protein CVV62_01400 [Tenericutes bacterium HGW-Tenericutes-7]
MNDFIENIVSLRQYKRYLYGTSEMPYKIFIKLCDKLKWNPMNILNELDQKKIAQLQTLDKFYNYVVSYNFDEASKLVNILKNTVFVDTNFETYFKIGLLLMEYWKSPTNPVSYANRCIELINYPIIMKNELFNPIELLALSVLLNFIQGNEKFDIIVKLENVLNSPNFHFLGKDFYVIQYIYVKLAKEYGIQKNDKKVIDLCEKSIKLAKLNYSYFNLDYLYYYLSLAYRNFDNVQKAHYYINLLIEVIDFQDNESKKNKFEHLIQSDFGFTFTSFKINYKS